MSEVAGVIAAGWIPFTVVLLLLLVFSFLYIRYFQSRRDSDRCTTATSVLGVFVALLTLAIVPLDIFMVSFMKKMDGTFQPWANSSNVRDQIENSILYSYAALYILIALFVFFIIPFSYFFYEEDEDGTTVPRRMCTALKFSAVFLVFAAVLLLLGAFIPFRGHPSPNSTEWETLELIFKELGSSHGEDMLSFVVSSLTLLGLLPVIVYTAYGMSAWPMDLIKGRRSASRERLEVERSREERRGLIDTIRKKYRDLRSMTTRDRRRLDQLEDEERLMSRRERHLVSTEQSKLKRCLVVCRPFQIVFGVICLLLQVLIFASLLITCIDKLIHSGGPTTGYALPHRFLPNPVDMTLVLAQQAFPLDYVLMTLIILYFFVCSMGGIQDLGIWFLWIKMYKIRPQHTRPQGLLFTCFLLMFIVLALNIILYSLTPQYSTFGSQHYLMVNNGTSTLQMCTMEAKTDQCVMTRMSLLLSRFFYKAWFFGAAYFWMTWAFLAVMLISFVVVIVRKRRSAIEGAVDEEDFDDSDEEMLRG